MLQTLRWEQHGGEYPPSEQLPKFLTDSLLTTQGVTEGFETHNRNNFDANITMQDLVDSYLLPFQSCVENGRVSGLMWCVVTKRLHVSYFLLHSKHYPHHTAPTIQLM